jgi:hypothetical protein
MSKDGLILVLDMDQTIIDSEPFFRQNPLNRSKIPEYLNMNIIHILLRAAKLRPNKVKGIFLLTNNLDKDFIAKVDTAILDLSMGSKGKYNTSESTDYISQKMPDKEYFFDDIFMLDHPKRKSKIPGGSPEVKDIHTVVEMIKTIDSTASPNIISKLFFFDDIPDHKLHDEFLNSSGGKYKQHYMTITPPYKKGITDKTNYTPILKALHKLDGKSGLRKTRKRPRFN